MIFLKIGMFYYMNNTFGNTIFYICRYALKYLFEKKKKSNNFELLLRMTKQIHQFNILRSELLTVFHQVIFLGFNYF